MSAISHKLMDDMLQANIEKTAENLNISPFWVELGSIVIPLVFFVLMFVIVCLVLGWFFNSNPNDIKK
ncbi:hypothetical protein [Vibrio scophthalmi]|uniref:Uncharacterized protein n=1 Tax=Vibrio scophthalmi TaxID=45658 RepID=A0A1E3WIS7_9VIBR|nr:hypothetical protein [Vibrio scophthalmi]ODS09632.1 hypothetical protein VSF3289_03296 [Vibrio scophthalmi]